MDERMNGRMKNGRKDERTDEKMDERMNGRKNGREAEWTDERMNGRTDVGKYCLSLSHAQGRDRILRYLGTHDSTADEFLS